LRIVGVLLRVMFKPSVSARPYWKHFIFAWALPPLVLLVIVVSGALSLSRNAGPT
jgi:hypothetical protein